jgi:hypothetical protein
MCDNADDLKQTVAQIIEILNSDKAKYEVRSSVSEAIKNSPCATLSANFGAAFYATYFDDPASTQIKAFNAVCAEMRVNEMHADAKRLCAAQAYVILDGHIIEEEVLEIFPELEGDGSDPFALTLTP